MLTVGVEAQEQPNASQTLFERAKVISVSTISEQNEEEFTQRVLARLTTGEQEDTEITIDYYVSPQIQTTAVDRGDTIVVVETNGPDGRTWYVVDQYRIPSLVFIFLLFLAVAGVFARKRAIYAVAGLACSVFVLATFIVPQIAQGRSPLLVGVFGSMVILFVSLFLAHGFHRKTTIALVGTLITVVIAALLATIFVNIADLFGFGSEAAYDLQFLGQDVEFKGLLLAGMIIGTLGVLDDVTTSLVATVHELHAANPRLNASELYTRGSRVGREHIVSLINTLVLAYAGASLPLMLLFGGDQQPLWVTLNSQLVGEEVVRTLVGSIALILAVPITTYLAAHIYAKNPPTRGVK
jgi:uncharacterized membrane protein